MARATVNHIYLPNDLRWFPLKATDRLFGFVPSLFQSFGERFASPCMQKISAISEYNSIRLHSNWDKTIRKTLLEATLEIEHKKGSWVYDKKVAKILSKLNDQEILELIVCLINLEVEKSNPNLHKHILRHLKVDQIKNAIYLKGESTRDCFIETAQLEVKAGKSLFGFDEAYPSTKDSNQIISAIKNFFPNLVNAFLFAFSFFDEGNQPEMPWDTYVLLDIYYKFLMIPSAIVVAISGLITSPLNAYVIAAGVTVGGLGALYGYFRWLRPPPAKLSYDTDNWTTKAKKNEFGPVAAREAEIEEIAKLQAGSDKLHKRHVIIVGDRGRGKTTLIKGATIRLAENPSTKQKQVYALKPATLTESSFSGGPSKKLSRLKSQLGKYRANAIFFIDEFDVVMKKMSQHIKTILDEKEITYWGATTLEGYKNIMNDPVMGPSILESCDFIFLSEPNKEDTEAYKFYQQGIWSMASSHVNYIRGIVPVDADAIRAAVEINHSKLEHRNQPRLACDLLEFAILRAKKNLDAENLVSEELNRKRVEKEKLVYEYATARERVKSPGSDVIKSLEDKILAIEKEIANCERILEEKKKKIRQIHSLYQEMYKKEKELFRVAKEILCQKHLSEEIKKSLLFKRHFSRLGLQIKIEQLESEIKMEYPTRVTAKMIQREIERMVNNLPDAEDAE